MSSWKKIGTLFIAILFMATASADIKFSQFANGGDTQSGDIIVGLRDGVNTQFNANTAASKSASSSAEDTVSSVTGSITSGNFAAFSDTKGTIEDSGYSISSFAPSTLGSVLITTTTSLSTSHQNKILKAGTDNTTVILMDSSGISTYPDGFSFTLVSDPTNAATIKFEPHGSDTIGGLGELVVPAQGSVTIYKNSAISSTDWQIASRSLNQNIPVGYVSGAVSVPLSMSGNTLISTGATPFNLPAIGSVTPNAGYGVNFTFINGTDNALPINAADGQSIYTTGRPTYYLYKNQSATFTTNGVSGLWNLISKNPGNGDPYNVQSFSSGYTTIASDLNTYYYNNEMAAATFNVAPNSTMSVDIGWHLKVACQNHAGCNLGFDGGDTVIGDINLNYGVVAEIVKTFSNLPSGSSVWQVSQSQPATLTYQSLLSLIPDTSNITNNYQVGDTFTIAGGTYATQAAGQVDSVHLSTYNISNGGTGAAIGNFVTLTYTGFAGTTHPVCYVTSVNAGASNAVTGCSFDSTAHPGATMGDMTNPDASTTFTQSSTTGSGTGLILTSPTYGVQTNHITNSGQYTVTPSNPVSQDATSGSGTGYQGTGTWG